MKELCAWQKWQNLISNKILTRLENSDKVSGEIFVLNLLHRKCQVCIRKNSMSWISGQPKFRAITACVFDTAFISCMSYLRQGVRVGWKRLGCRPDMLRVSWSPLLSIGQRLDHSAPRAKRKSRLSGSVDPLEIPSCKPKYSQHWV